MGESGRIEWFDANKGFGWITLTDGSRAYLHRSALRAGYVPAAGDAVELELLRGPAGASAVDVRPASTRSSPLVRGRGV